MRLCVPAVGKGGTGQDDASTAGRVEVAASVASGWMKGTGTGERPANGGNAPTHPSAPQPLWDGGFSPTDHPSAHIAEASVCPSANLPADKGALGMRSHVFLFVLALLR